MGDSVGVAGTASIAPKQVLQSSGRFMSIIVYAGCPSNTVGRIPIWGTECRVFMIFYTPGSMSDL